MVAYQILSIACKEFFIGLTPLGSFPNLRHKQNVGKVIDGSF